MAKHTPGPWTVDRDNDVLAPDGTGIAAVHGEDAENEEANARLIAAAPKMLAKLKHLYEYEANFKDWDDVAALIAEAEGRADAE